MMISIAEAISDLLFVRDTVVVPGLGAFVRKPCSAKVDTKTNSFAMPSSQISFDASLREDNDIIIKYLVNEIGISENEAKRMLFHFVSECYNSLKSGQQVQLKNIGILSFGPENEMLFEQDGTANYNTDAFGLCDFSMPPVVRLEKKDEESATDEGQQPNSDNVKLVEENIKTEQEEERRIGKGVWAFMIGLMLIVLAVFLNNVFHFIPQKQNPTELATDSKDDNAEIKAVEEMMGELIEQAVRKELEQPVVEETRTADTIRIIAGCYDKEDFAQRIVNSLKNKGYPNAFMEKRGERWFVAYDRYHTEEEAREALREIREVKGEKGWILK